MLLAPGRIVELKVIALALQMGELGFLPRPQQGSGLYNGGGPCDFQGHLQDGSRADPQRLDSQPRVKRSLPSDDQMLLHLAEFE